MLKRVILKFTSVRTLIALAVTGTACYLAIVDRIPPETFMIVMTAITVFYFEKDRKESKDE